MADDLKDEIKLSVDASGVETGVSRAKRSIDSLGQSIQDAGRKGGDGLGQIGSGGARAAQDMDASTRRIVSSLERQIVATRAGGTATREYQETMAKLRGANMDVLRPYLDQLEKVQQETRKAISATEGFTDAARSMGNVLGGLALGLASAFSLRTFIDETVAAEQEQAQLAAVLKSTGNAAGYSREQLNRMAADMAAASNFSSGEINKAQTRLLSYTGIVGTQFPRAMQAASDMAARMGTDLSSAAETIGRALDVPSQGLTALTRQGFRFTEEQKAMVEQMEATGRTAEAQGMILAALETSYGGAASAARDGLGGSLTALKNTIKSLMTGEGGSVDGLRQSIEQVNDTLSSPQVREAFRVFTDWIGVVSAAAIKGAANLLAFITAADKLGIVAGTDSFGKMKSDAAALTAEIVRLTDRAERFQEAINRGDNVAQNQRNLDKTRQRIAELQKQAMDASQKLKDFANDSVKTATAPILGPDLPVTAPTPTTARAAKGKGAVSAVNRELEEQAKLIAELSGLSGSFAKDWDNLNKLYAKGAISLEQLTAAQATLLEKQPGIKAAMQEEAKAREDALKAALKGYEEEQKAQEKVLQQRQQAADSAEKAVQAAVDEAEAHALSATAQVSLAEAVAMVAVARAEEVYQKELSNGADGATLLALQKEIEARKKLVGLIRDREFRKADEKFAEQAAKDWEKAADDINKSLTDALLRGFESGKGFAENLRDTVKNMFSTLVLRPIISAVMQPVSMLINGAVQGGLSALMGGGGSGGAMGLLNGASTLNTAYNAFTGGITSSLGGYISTLGTKFGSTAATSFGMGMQGITLDASLMSTYGGTAYSAGSTVAAAMPYVAIVAAAAAVASSLWEKGWNQKALQGAGKTFMYDSNLSPGMEKFNRSLFSKLGMNDKWADILSGTTRMAFLFGRKLKDYGIEGTFGGETGFEGQKWQYYKGGLLRSNKTKYETLEEEDRKALGDRFLGIKDGIADMAASLGIGEQAFAGFSSSIKLSMKDLKPEEIEAKLQEEFAKITEGLAQAAIGQWEEVITAGADSFFGVKRGLPTVERVYKPSEYAREGEAAIDTLTRLATSLAGVNGMFDMLGTTLYEASLASGDMASQLVDAFGGLENMAQASGAYFQNFYTAQEQLDHLGKSLRDQLSSLDLTLPDGSATDAREQYRALAEAQDLTTEAGRKAYAMLLQLSGGYAQWVDGMRQAQQAMLQSVGVNGEQIATTLRDALLGRVDYAQAGTAIADMVVGGVYNALAGGVATQITDMLTQQLVVPMVQAAVAGTSVSAAVSQSAIDAIVAHAQAAAAALNAVLSDPALREALDQVASAIGSVTQVAGTGVKPYTPAVIGGGGGSTVVDPVREAWRDMLADIVEQTKEAGRQLALVGKTSYEVAIADLENQAKLKLDELKAAGYGVPADAGSRTRDEYNRYGRLLQFAEAYRDGKTESNVYKEGADTYFFKSGEALDAEIARLRATFEALGKRVADVDAGLAGLPPEIRAWLEAEKALLDARNAAAAAQTIGSIERDIKRLGMTDLERELDDIAQRTQDFIDGLKDLGQATDSNLDAVSRWSDAMTEAAKKRDAEAKKREAETAVMKATDAAYSALERAVNAQRKALDASLSTAQDLAQEVRSVFDVLKSAVDDLYRSVDSTAQQGAQAGRSFIADALAGALATGSLPDSKELQDAISAARGGMDAKLYASRFEADRDRLVLAGQLDTLKELGGLQLTEAERQIKALEDQLKTLDQTLETAREQIDVLRGIDTSVLSVADALKALAQAILGESAVTGGKVPDNPVGKGTSYTNSFGAAIADGFDRTIQSLFKSVFGRDVDAAGLEWYRKQLVGADGKATMSGHELENLIKGGAKGEDVILPKTGAWAQAAYSGGAEMVQELRALRAQNERMEARMAAIAENTGQFAEQFDNVTAGGNAMATETL